MKPSEVLREARNQIMERGWYQGTYEGPDGSVCAFGAIHCAVFSEAWAELVEASAWDTAEGAKEALHIAVDAWAPSWNDARGRTIHEVLDAFDKAEKIAEIKESRAEEK